MKYVLLIFTFLFVGCTTKQVENTTSVLDFVEGAGNIAGAAGVPLAGAVATAFGFASLTIKGWFKTGSEKEKNHANYQAVNNIHNAVVGIADQLKSGNIEPEKAADELSVLVKSVAETTHIAYGVYKGVEKDVQNFRKKKMISKLG